MADLEQDLITQIKSSKVELSSSDKDREQGKRDLENSLRDAKKILEKSRGTPLYNRFLANYNNLIANIKQSIKDDKTISIKERNTIINEYRKMFLLDINTKKQKEKEVNFFEKGINLLDEAKIKVQLGSINNGFGNGKLHLYSEKEGNTIIDISSFEIKMRGAESIQVLNGRGLYNYIQYLKSKGSFNSDFIQKFDNPIITKENLSKFEQNYKSGKVFTIEKQVERVENIGSETLVKVKLGSISNGFGNGKLHLYSEKEGNTIIDISTFEKKISGVKNILELNGRGLYNYIQYLRSKGSFNSDFIQKFDNPIITKENLSKFEQNYKSGKVFTIEKAWEKHNQVLNQTKKKFDEGVQYIKKNIERIYRKNETRDGKTLSQRPQEKGKNTIPNSPQVKKGGEKELPLKYEKGEKIHITLGGRNINVSLEKSEGGYNMMYRGRIILPDLTQDEVERTNKNPQAGANLIKFHRIFNSQRIGVNLPSIWRYRNEIIKGIDNTKVNQNDDFLNENEVLRFLNIIITFINKSGGKLTPVGNTNQMRESLKSFSGADNFLNKKAKNERGEDKFAQLLRNKGVIREDNSFNIIKFQTILKTKKELIP